MQPPLFLIFSGLDDHARLVERHTQGRPVEALIAEERRLSHSYAAWRPRSAKLQQKPGKEIRNSNRVTPRGCGRGPWVDSSYINAKRVPKSLRKARFPLALVLDGTVVWRAL